MKLPRGGNHRFPPLYLLQREKLTGVNKGTKMMEIMQKLAVANPAKSGNGPQHRGECWKFCRKKAKIFI